MIALRRLRDEEQWPGHYSGGTQFSQSNSLPVISRPEVSSSAGEIEWFDAIRTTMLSLSMLREDNWDRRGSAAVRSDVIAYAWQILFQIMPLDGIAPNIVPLGHGGVQMEWRTRTADFEIEIVRPFEASAVYFDADGSENDIPIGPSDLDGIAVLLREKFRR
jgi:hypothetical protein